MHPIRSILRFALGVALAGAAIGLVPAVASAAKQPTCTYDNGSRQVSVFDKSDVFPLELAVVNGEIAARTLFVGSQVRCFSTTGSGLKATIDNTDRIVVSGSPLSTGDGYIVDQHSGAFAPGFTKEADGTSEIEILLAVPRDAAGEAPTLEIDGTNAADAIRVGGPGAVNFGNDGDIDVVVQSGASSVTVRGGDGADFITGLGNEKGAILGRTARPLHFNGENGNDFLFGGDGRDELYGGFEIASGDDYIQTPDGVFDVVNGGPGLDAGITDFLDDVKSLESNVVMPIGAVELSPRAVRARAGRTTRLSMSWTHPMAWRELRSVELLLYDGANKRVGSVMARAGGLTSRGRVKVMARSRVTHRDKTVTAKLALRLPRSVAGQNVRVAVEATDRLGHRQVEPDAGAIRVGS